MRTARLLCAARRRGCETPRLMRVRPRHLDEDIALDDCYFDEWMVGCVTAVAPQQGETC